MKKRWFVVVLILALGLSSGKLFAQPAEPPSPREDRPMNQERAEELRKKVELIWMWKLTEELNLSEKEGAKLFPVVHTYEEKKRGLREENRRLVRELERMIKDKASEGELKRTIQAVEQNDRKLQEVEQEGFHEIAKILSVEKQARYIVFQAHFQHEIHGLIQGARHKEVRPGKP
jgi:regulator of replication initiation timing